MRDPKRIEKILEVIRCIWESNPDLRLGQIIDNSHLYARDLGHTANLFYIEDDALSDGLEELKKVIDGRDRQK